MNRARAPQSEEIPCNLCGECNFDVIGEADRDGRPLRTTICRTCGLVWTNPRPPRASIDRYYASDHYRQDYQGGATPTPRKVLRGIGGALDRRRALIPLVRPGARIIDVGCGAGEFVYLMRADGMDASGVEPSDAFAEFARDVLQVPIQNVTVDAADVAPESCDMVTMFHALEHLADPLATLSVVRGWLRRGGFLLVEVPNVDARCQAPRHRFHYAHPFAFSSGTLSAMGERAGLRTVRTWFTDDGGNVTCLFRRQADQSHLPRDLAQTYLRTKRIVATHTTLSHYFSPIPYRRAVRRLARHRREDRLLGRLRSIDAILRWGIAGGLDDL